jgi:hypothetical protein
MLPYWLNQGWPKSRGSRSWYDAAGRITILTQNLHQPADADPAHTTSPAPKSPGPCATTPRAASNTSSDRALRIWTVPDDELYALEHSPRQLECGSLDDDLEFVESAQCQSRQAIPLMFVHLAPLLRALASAVPSYTSPNDHRRSSPRPTSTWDGGVKHVLISALRQGVANGHSICAPRPKMKRGALDGPAACITN